MVGLIQEVLTCLIVARFKFCDIKVALTTLEFKGLNFKRKHLKSPETIGRHRFIVYIRVRILAKIA